MDLSDEKKRQVKQYYLQDDIVEEMVRVAQHREVAPTYPWGYGQRPDAVNFPGDFKNFVEQNAVAFHGSVEIWRNPHLIDTVDDHDDIRHGWDLVIDIDCDHSIELSKITADAVVSELEAFGVDHVSVKFSGNRGFHIGVRREAFPDKVEGRDHSDWYPEMPQAVVSFLRHRLRDQLTDAFRDHDPDVEEMMADDDSDALNPYAVCDIENNWGDRHLFRMPYSINEKSWLVSLPIARDRIMDFEKDWATMDDATVDERFLDTYEEGEATELVIEALDWRARNRDTDDSGSTSFDGDVEIPDDAIPEEYFPPTIHNILAGLEDGRKRSVFILATFLRHCGYDWDAVEQMLWEWNERNDEPLSERYIETQLNWHRRQDEPRMPPNWDSDGFYQDLGVYEEDPLTERVSNPVAYAFAKWNDEEEDSDADDDGGGGSDKEIVECPYCGKEYKGETKWYKDHVVECTG